MTAWNSPYFGGAEILPPLDKDEETRLLAVYIRDGDIQAKRSLIEHNLRLVIYIARHFQNTGVGTEELISIGTIGLIKGINTFKPDKNTKLVTYVTRCIRNEILMFLRHSKNMRTEISIEELETQNLDSIGDDMILCNLEIEEDYQILRTAISKLTLQEQKILQLRYGIDTGDGKEKTQKEVSDLLGLSQSYISRIEKRIIRQLRAEFILLDS